MNSCFHTNAHIPHQMFQLKEQIARLDTKSDRKIEKS